MNTTGQITQQIDAVVQSIAEYHRDLQAENQRSAKVKADALARSEAQKLMIQQDSDKEIKGYEDAHSKAIGKLNTFKLEVQAFENKLKKLIPRNRVAAIPPVNDKFTVDDANDLIAKIEETGLWAWIKKLLELGDYKANSAMAAELYGKIDNAYNYVKRSAQSEDTKRADKIQKSKQSAGKRVSAVEAQYQQDIRNEDQLHASRMQMLTQRESRLRTDAKLAGIRKTLDQAAAKLGLSSAGWKTYVSAKAIPEEILIGTILWPCKIANPTAEESKLLNLIPQYNSAANGFTVPLTAPANKPILMYMDCAAGDVRFAAGVYQSIIARMIRFFPPKSFRSVFFDPVNRSTSLGQLIHLSGDKTSRVCEYHLSGQDINARMDKLTKHVDEVCRKLTAANCADINAYNAIPKVSRIAYSAVVIHDFPQGFDSTSLGNLEVLINKAAQCGISILISHKQSDKIEHRALEVLKLITKEFQLGSISAQGKARITMGGHTYQYKPCPVQPEKAYLDQINKLFTYRAPIKNDFASIFGGKLPARRDATKGLDIPFAVDGKGNVIDLQIGYDLSAFGILSGGTGSGKTTLLHMLITSAAMHYDPSDLELWLVDYKLSEFAFYKEHCPPHVRYVVADQSDEITYSVLDRIHEESSRRYRLFRKHHTEDYVGFVSSPVGKGRLPRIFVIIDEFHRMAQALQEEAEYKKKLENIINEARGAGITMLLCDQEISNGLSGLSPKSRDALSVRIALRNKPEEVREMLALPNSLVDERIKKMIDELASAVQGSLIYKYERKNPDNPMSNEVLVNNYRGIYAEKAERTVVMDSLAQKYAGFQRERTFYLGAKRHRMEIEKLKNYEKHHPQLPGAGERFYIGTPVGIQPCFYFNLKNGEGGENLLLVGNNHEMRISLLKSILSCAARYKYKVKILASRNAQLYRQNKSFFDSLKKAEVITGFPQICKYVGERANELKKLYADDDSDFDNPASVKELAIFVGLDDIYSQMEASMYNQKTAWTVEEPQVPSPAPVVPVKTPAPDPVKKTPAPGPSFPKEAPAPEPSDNPCSAQISDIDKLMASLGLGGGDGTSVTASITELYAGSGSKEIKGYNAVKDLSKLITDGWQLGISSMVVVDRGTAFSRMREVKLESNFNHRIALVMSSDEAQRFMSKTKVMKGLIDQNDTISAVYEYLGGREQCFRPYRFD